MDDDAKGKLRVTDVNRQGQVMSMLSRILRTFAWTSRRKIGVIEKRVLITAALFALVSSVPDIVLPGSGVGSFGFWTDLAGHVKRVSPGGSADVSGIHTGHHIDLAATPPESRRYLLDFGYASENAPASFADDQKPGTLINMTASKAHFSGLETAASILFGFAYLTLILTGMGLVFDKPSLMTRAFFWYAIMTANWSWLLSATLPWPVYEPWSTIEGFMYVLNWVPLTIFALIFPVGWAAGWRTRAQLPISVLVVIGAVIAILGVVGYWLLPGNPVTRLIFYEPLVGLAIALGLVVANFLKARGDEQKQLGWVMSALIIGDLSTLVGTLATFNPWPDLDIWAINLLSGMNIVVPIAVAVAIKRYHLFGIVVRPTVAYPVVAFLILIVRAVLERYIGHIPSAPAVEFLVAIVAAISFAWAQQPLGRWIDRMRFKSQRRVRRALYSDANDIARVPSQAGLSALIVGAVVERLSIVSAALYRRTSDGFKRVASHGFDAEMPETLDDGNELLKQMRERPKPLAVPNTMQSAERLSRDARGPFVALPVIVRNEVEAILVYGPYRSGGELEPYDVKTLQRLAAKAGTISESLRAEREGKMQEEQRNTVRELRGVMHRMAEALKY